MRELLSTASNKLRNEMKVAIIIIVIMVILILLQ